MLEFDVARFWVEFHKLPHSMPLGSKRTHSRHEAKTDSWIKLKYGKLPYLCFNCGKLAHINTYCVVSTPG
ncbi:hypothetical protein G4B88_019418 [Cannabis sativa]|uniref:Zinc knuckle CX2CX4HX4C domain-containing protein n=1 Tax=Cannabis sativa TaxID=3483 RepID=A0A7J6HZE4_CANSA|nr:hypothetical protein G4B88_019418 [Cannabis sativa]